MVSIDTTRYSGIYFKYTIPLFYWIRWLFVVTTLPVGKLPSELLQRLLSKGGRADEQVMLGPSIGEDAVILRIGNKLLIATADPATFAIDLIGW